MRDEPTISVIICAHADERRDLLRAAIESVRAQEGAPAEIIVVVDHNPPLAEWLAATCSGVTIVANSGERGLSGARNSGIRHARGEVLAFIDDDATAESGWLKRIRTNFSDPKIIGVGGRIVAKWLMGRPRWFPIEFDWVVGCSYRGQPERLAAVRNLIGCNMSFRRAVFDRVGGFREGLGRLGSNAAGCEETELCIRAAHAFPGSTIVYDPELAVRHHISQDRVGWRYFYKRCVAEGRSKASMVGNVGPRSGLSTERRYATRVLPVGVARGFGDAFLKFDMAGLARAGAIVGGFACVLWGYLSTPSGISRDERAPDRSFKPFRIVDLDISDPLHDIDMRNPTTGAAYGGAFCLVRRAGRPVDVVELPCEGDNLPASMLKELLGDRTPPSEARVQVASVEEAAIRVVIATRDRAASLARTLDSLLRQDYGNFEIVVVDNAPASSETADLIASDYAASGRVRYLREPRPGLGVAHNRGLADCTAPIVAFTDDDVIVDPRWLSAIASAFATSRKVGCVTGLILPAELETRSQYWTERHGGFGKGLDQRIFDLDEHRPESKLFPFAAGAFGSGANMAFSTEALVRVRGFDPALGAGTHARGGDDLAAFVSVLRAGYQLVYQPEAIVWHYHRRTEEGMRRQAYGYGVGLGAYLTKLVVDEPSLIFRFAAASPGALAHILGASSPKNLRLPDDYPKSLVWRERLGILAGVRAYLRSRLAAKRSHGSSRAEGLLPVGSQQQEIR